MPVRPIIEYDWQPSWEWDWVVTPDETPDEEPDDEDYEDEDWYGKEEEEEDRDFEDEDSSEEELGGLGAPNAEAPDETDTAEPVEVQFQWFDLVPDEAAIEEIRKGRISVKGRRTVQEFDTVRQFVNLVTSPDGIDGRRRRLSRGEYRDWRNPSRSQTKAQTIEMMSMGWREGVENISKFNEKIKRLIRGSIRVPEIRYAETGEMLDVARWVEGDPEDFMYESESEKEVETKRPKILRIVSTIDIASYDSAVMRGAAVVALTQMLELMGTRVIIDAHCGSNNIVDTWCRVKEVDAPVNLESMVAVLCHPAVFHHMVMGAWEHLPEDVRRQAGGLGTDSWGWISEPTVDERGDVYVSAISTAWTYSEEATLDWVKKELVKAGIELVEEVK